MNRGRNRFLLASVSAVAIGFTSAALAAGGGKVYLSQTGDNQDAAIHQDGGTNNTVGSSGTPFLQENGSGSGHNVLVINQNAGIDSGLSNIGDFVHTGSGNRVTGFQSGTANNAEIDQMGNNSRVNLEQTGANNGAPDPNNPTWFNQTPGNVILQDSTANGSRVDLTQTNNIGATNGNVFSIGQGGTNNRITATQNGYNKLWIRQGTTAPGLWGWTYGNPFDPAETPNSLSALRDSTITVNQWVGGTDPGVHNYAALGQGHGSGNKITVTQTRPYNSVDVNQVGSDNIFTSDQTSVSANTARNFIGGEAGYPSNWTNPLTGTAGDVRPIAQIGTGNEYHSLQSGTSLWAFGNQNGNYNFLNSVQTGDQNTLYSTQNGNSNTIYGTQDGSTNLAQVSQNHNSSTTVFSQSGTGNAATITQ